MTRDEAEALVVEIGHSDFDGRVDIILRVSASAHNAALEMARTGLRICACEEHFCVYRTRAAIIRALKIGGE